MKTHVRTAKKESQSLETPNAEWIKARAYELYLKRGEQPGHELEDWLKAEQEGRQQKQAGR